MVYIKFRIREIFFVSYETYYFFSKEYEWSFLLLALTNFFSGVCFSLMDLLQALCIFFTFPNLNRLIRFPTSIYNTGTRPPTQENGYVFAGYFRSRFLGVGVNPTPEPAPHYHLWLRVIPRPILLRCINVYCSK